MTTQQCLLRGCLSLAALWWVVGAQAQMTPIGNWHTLDDQTGEIKGLVTLSEMKGVVSGRVQKILRKNTDPNERCTLCTDDRKDQLIVGMEVVRGAKKVSGREVWEDGKILDPENGKEYTLRLTPFDNGQKLEVRGYIAFFYRNQTWVRVP